MLLLQKMALYCVALSLVINSKWVLGFFFCLVDVFLHNVSVNVLERRDMLE
jgi:hypothetical protein